MPPRRTSTVTKTPSTRFADTTALMIAVYSDLVFADTGLYDDALAAQRRVDLTLVTALDLPWLADGLMRDGAHVRERGAQLRVDDHRRRGSGACRHGARRDRRRARRALSSSGGAAEAHQHRHEDAEHEVR